MKNLSSVDEDAPVVISILLAWLLAWLIAAVLHFAIGSVSVGAITAAGISSPIVGTLGGTRWSSRGFSWRAWWPRRPEISRTPPGAPRS